MWRGRGKEEDALRVLAGTHGMILHKFDTEKFYKTQTLYFLLDNGATVWTPFKDFIEVIS